MARPSEPKLGRVVSRARGKLKTLVASAVRVDQENSQQMQRLFQPWQAEALSMYDQLPEIKFAAMFVARPLEKIRLYVAVLDDKGQPGEEAPEEAQAILDRVQDPGGGRSVMMSTYGRLMFLTGEGRLICTPDPDRPEEDGQDGECWEFVSTLELRVNPGNPPTYTRTLAPQLGPITMTDASDDNFEALDDGARVYRFWRRHPAYSRLADSSMQAVLGACEELLLLSASVRAHTVSRLAGSGILLVPEEISPAPPMPVGDEDPVEDPFMEELTLSMLEPIKDPTSADAAVPLIVRGQAEYLKEFRHLSVHDPSAVYPEIGLREEVIGRIATGLDIPREILLGVTDANHWTAWQVDEQTWVSHQEPLARMFCDDLTSSYFRKAAKDAGIANWADLVVTYDPASVVNHPDRSQDAKDLHDRLVISDEALRTANGFTDDDTPSQDEWDKRAALKGKGTTGTQLLEQAGVPAGTAPGKAGPAGAEDVKKGPPAEPQTVSTSTNGVQNGNQQAVVAGAAEMGVVRARELAGSRLRAKVQGRPELRDRVDGELATLVASALGADVVNEYGGATLLVSGAASSVVAGLNRLGVGDAENVGLEVEAYAARTLLEPEPAPFPG